MSVLSPTLDVDGIVYPDSDGEPLSDNTLQLYYIILIKSGLDVRFADEPDVFIAGDLLWYPVQGRPDIRIGPDALVALGRPKGHRGSYRQWREGDHPPDVVFEINSPGNRAGELRKKFAFYDRYGVQEYYFYDPDTGKLEGWERGPGGLQPIPTMQGWISPRLGIRFEATGTELHLYHPNGEPFVPLEEEVRERRRVAQERDEIAQERDEIAQERDEIAQERDQARQLAERERLERERAEQERGRERERAERLAMRLRELGIDPADV